MISMISTQADNLLGAVGFEALQPCSANRLTSNRENPYGAMMEPTFKGQANACSTNHRLPKTAVQYQPRGRDSR